MSFKKVGKKIPAKIDTTTFFIYNRGSNPPIFMFEEEPTDLWEDMATLNALYEELCWEPDVPLEFSADYENDRIIIKRKK